jgi:hypothetical protein
MFRGARGGMLSESVYCRAWHAARVAAFGPDLAAIALARRPYDLRHAALSLWLNATGAPAEVAVRAGNSPRVLQDVYLHCMDGQDDLISQQIEDALDAGPGSRPSSQYVKASGYTHRRHQARNTTCTLAITSVSAGQMVSEAPSAEAGQWTDPAHAWPTGKADGLMNRSHCIYKAGDAIQRHRL